jgi:hypothetical protein
MGYARIGVRINQIKSGGKYSLQRISSFALEMALIDVLLLYRCEALHEG